MKSKTTAGVLLTLTATVIWSWNFIVARALADSVPPVALAFFRWLTAVVVLLPFSIQMMWRERNLIRKHALYLIAAGALAVTLFNTLVYIAGQTSSALNMSLIAISSPVFVLILARVFLNERFTLHRVAGLMLAVTGVATLVTDGHLGRLTTLNFTEGDLIMVVAAILFAVYSVLVRFKPTKMDQWVFLSSIISVGSLMLLPWFLYEQASAPRIDFTPTIVISILYLGIGPSLISFYCFNKAVLMIGPARVGFIYYSLPLFSGFEALLVLDEPIQWVHIASSLLIISGIVLATRDGRKGLQRTG